MRNLLHLYIGSKEVEFSTPPEILYTYQQSELTNPTIVKNSFSKTITIEGTPANNQIFGHFWSVQRLQDTSAEGEGVYFNASRKVPFVLYLDSNIYEQGYVKLDNVKMVGQNITYSISLYGGLGDFFYNLSQDGNGNERKLSDLDFEEDLSFTANIHTIKEAWDALANKTNGKWQTLNFMTAYNGLPEDFDAKKILINTKGTNLATTKTTDKTYKTKDGFVMAELPDEMTEWEVRDLRSYLQRPCIRMRKIVEACCKPENNGGYDVVLDPDFFNDNNPYWNDTWLTMPMIQSLEYSDEEQILEGATLSAEGSEGDVNSYINQSLVFDLGEFSQSIPSSIKVKGKIKFKGNKTHPYTSFVWYWNKKGDSYHSGHACYGSIYAQLVALNNGVVVGASEAYNLTSPNRHDGELRFGNNSRYESSHQFTPYMNKPIYDKLGWCKNEYWCTENTTTPIEFSFTINNLNSNVTELKMVYFFGSSKDKRKKDGVNGFYDTAWDSGWATYSRSWRGMNATDFEFDITSSNVQAVVGESLGRTGTRVEQDILLNTEATPCDYLLSYTKMFGLYYTKDVESNTIYIETRKSFYNRSEVIDLTDLIDHSKDIDIQPLTFDTKWYQFKQESDETQFYENYLTTRGVEYGSKILNTGYEFIADKKQLLEDNVIKSGIEGLEKSKYFTAYNNDNKIRPWFCGLKYNLYNGEDTLEVVASTASSGMAFNLNEDEGMKYYDVFPKLQFHDADKSSTDGNNVLVFFSGFKNVVSGRANPLSYYLTDDTGYQTDLNDGTPCWLFTTQETINNTRIAYKLSELPVFERYLTNTNSTSVKKSLDFGSPQELYVPNYSITEETNIYYNFWKTYLEDLYDVNNRILTCYVRIVGRPNPNWLRRFYWYDNALWQLNKIIDWNVSAYDTTRVEFIKVQSLDGYTSITQESGSNITLIPNITNIPSTGGFVDVVVITNSFKERPKWKIITTSKDIILDKTEGEGDGVFRVTIAQNNSNAITPIYITAVDEFGMSSKIYLQQGYSGETFFDVEPDSLIVSGGEDVYNVNFKWFNQGNNEVDGHRINGDINASVEGDTLTIMENETPTTISGSITYTSSGLYEDTLYIDQLPKALYFPKEGDSITLTINHSTPKFSDVPYWITITDNGDKTYTFTAKENLYPSIQREVIKVNTADLSVYQDAGGITIPTRAEVSPNSLYFNAEGGLLYLMVNIPNTWLIVEDIPWVDTNLRNGDGDTILGVQALANNGDTRSGILKVRDIVSGVDYNVYISQMGSNTTRTFSINPTSLNVPSSGGTYTISVLYEGRNGDYVNVEGSGGFNYGFISWEGDVGSIDITIPQNATTQEKTYTLTLTSAIGTAILSIRQDRTTAVLTTSVDNITSPFGGDTTNVVVSSNTSWRATTNDSWISIYPNSGYADEEIEMTITTAKNEGETRTGYVTFTEVETGDVLKTITIRQTYFDEILTISPSSVVFDADGGTATINIHSNGSWEIILNE